MSDSEKDFADQAIEFLASLSDEEFRARLAEYCPELLEDPGEPPPDAMLPPRRREDPLRAVAERLSALEAEVKETNRELRRLARSLPTASKAGRAKTKQGRSGSASSPSRATGTT